MKIHLKMRQAKQEILFGKFLTTVCYEIPNFQHIKKAIENMSFICKVLPQ